MPSCFYTGHSEYMEETDIEIKIKNMKQIALLISKGGWLTRDKDRKKALLSLGGKKARPLE